MMAVHAVKVFQGGVANSATMQLAQIWFLYKGAS
jgi:hypothetical protein